MISPTKKKNEQIGWFLVLPKLMIKIERREFGNSAQGK
jgi:hypothetical protein